jgi:hypothetical protein
VHGHGRARYGRLDDRALGQAQPHALARFDDVVARIAVAGQPDPPVDHGQVSAQVPELQRLAGVDALQLTDRGVDPGPTLTSHLEGSTVKQFEVRIHHQSPELRIAIIVVLGWVIQ